MKKLVFLLCILLLTACATNKGNVKKPHDMQQPSSSVETSGTKITKWDKEKLKGLNKENIGEQSINEQKISEKMLKEKEYSESEEIKKEISKFSQTDIHFDYDDFKIKAEDIPYLESLAQWLDNHPEYRLTIEGHCDERGSDLYNLALGEKRANSTKNFLVSLGVDASRVDCISYGEEKPLDPRHNEAAWAKNRRCHFDISK